MQFKKVLISVLKFTYPYILIHLATLISNYFVFFNGIMSGDDIRFHMFQIQDLIIGFERGYFGLTTNHVFMGGFAVNNYGFYGPVPHYCAAIIGYLFKWAGGNAEFGYKSVIIISSFVGGVYFYKLAYKMSHNKLLSLSAAILFIFMPYRIFCAVCRCAFAEVVAICFIPMIFYGAYSIVHDKTYSVSPYIALAIGASVVIMSHPFTGLMCALFGVLYLVFNIKFLFKKRDGFTIWPSVIGTILIIVCLIGFYVGNALTTKNAGIYRLNDPIIDWTNFNHVADSTELSLHFSGFLNLIWINGVQGGEGWNNETVANIILSLFVFVIGVINMMIADSLTKLAPKNKYYRWAVDVFAAFMFLPLFSVRLEIYLAVLIAAILFILVSYLFDKSKINNSPDFSSLKFNPDLYFLVTVIIISFLMMFVPSIWALLPEIFYQCQFAWRIWGICMFFVAMLITLLLSHVQQFKGALSSFAIGSAFVLCLSQGLLEKRIAYSLNQTNFHDINETTLIDNYEARYSGAQNEMVPLVLMDNDYKPTYSNSLWYKVNKAFRTWYYESNPFIYSIDDYKEYNPVFLEGEGTIEITNYNSPNNSFDITVTSETSLVQFPQIFNVGYVAYSNGKYLGSAENIDGLIAFRLPKGTYSIDLVFKNSKAYQIARPFFYVGLVSLIPFGLFGLYYKNKHKRDITD